MKFDVLLSSVMVVNKIFKFTCCSYLQCELSYSYIVVEVEGHDSKLLHTYFFLSPIATQHTGKRQFNSNLGKFWENADFGFMAKN